MRLAYRAFRGCFRVFVKYFTDYEIALAIDTFPQSLPRLEMRSMRPRHAHRLTSFRIPPDPRRPVIQAEDPKPPNLDTAAGRERLGNGAENFIHGHLGVDPQQLWETITYNANEL